MASRSAPVSAISTPSTGNQLTACVAVLLSSLFVHFSVVVRMEDADKQSPLMKETLRDQVRLFVVTS